MSIVLISPQPPASHLWAAPAVQHLIANFPSQMAGLRPERYRFLSVFSGSEPRALSALVGELPPAIVINNSANGERLKRGEFERVVRHQEALGLPVINAAEGAARCTRVETAELLRGIPDLLVPKIMRFRNEAGLGPSLRKAICELFPLPVILRTAGHQEQRNMVLVSTPAEIEPVLGQFLDAGERDFYAIAYRDVQHENGLYRRIRAAYVAGVPTLMRVDYSEQWIVKGRKHAPTQDHYRRDPGLVVRADTLVREPEGLGEKAWAVLREVGRRMPLDIFGMDFDVDREGQVVFFEANATMNLLSNAPRDIDYPAEGQNELLARADAYFLKRAGVSLQ